MAPPDARSNMLLEFPVLYHYHAIGQGYDITWLAGFCFLCLLLGALLLVALLHVALVLFDHSE